ncbi:MAG: hypothetical protein CMM52_05555 [Rhodospirillaceae bacterium]|nr:hypothetical protein [Rhodospirillaceae bacterium]|tara:strand:- start:1657 stop:2103 length:447 start_codon:yes stop_codon:yes gene_type:complete
MTEKNLLKLRATDTDDLAIISTFLQDAVIAVNEMTFLKKESRFAFVANRFRWEDADRERPVEGDPIYERVHCGICFDTVTAVRQNGLDQQRKAQVVSLLSIVAEDGFIDLAFSAGITVRLEVEKILCHLQDLNEPWPTQWRPSHPLED